MAAVTQAFVLGAGLGTRLRPLTDDLPKPLIPIFQKPLITFALDHLIGAGVERFIINTHRLPESF
jgi:mannose-1-phosphate guanylyltransferase